MEIRIGHSPDPDDAFLFYAITQGIMTFPGYTFTHCIEGIEALNQRAMHDQLEMTAISVHAYAYLADKYVMLTAGASMGSGYGPILVTKEDMSLNEVKKKTIAVPGSMTSAALLIQLALGGKLDLQVMPFDEIMPAVADGKIDAGVLIHEGQLTYHDAGVKNLLDLGIWWGEQTDGLPCPLGVNALRRDLGEPHLTALAKAFQDCLNYSFEHRKEAIEFSMQYGRGLDVETTDKFVGMYVDDLTKDCRPNGAKSMQLMLDWAADEQLIPKSVPVEFVEV